MRPLLDRFDVGRTGDEIAFKIIDPGTIDVGPAEVCVHVEGPVDQAEGFVKVLFRGRHVPGDSKPEPYQLLGAQAQHVWSERRPLGEESPALDGVDYCREEVHLPRVKPCV